MRVTAKGQVTIPINIREELDMLPNTEVRFTVRDGAVVIEKVHDADAVSRGKKLVARMSGRGTFGMSTDEIMGLTRGEE